MRIPLRYMSDVNENIRVIADPFNEYHEIDELNNVSAVEGAPAAGSVAEVIMPSPAGSMELTVNLPSSLPQGLRVRVYSIDGRLVTDLRTETLHSGSNSILAGAESGTGRLPAGMYMVCIEGLGSGHFSRKIIILDN